MNDVWALALGVLLLSAIVAGIGGPIGLYFAAKERAALASRTTPQEPLRETRQVFVLLDRGGEKTNDGSTLLGVFSTLEIAKQYASNDCEGELKWRSFWYHNYLTTENAGPEGERYFIYVKQLAALASRTTPQEPNDNAK